MGPKKATGSAPKKSSSHGSYKDMIKVAIITLKDRMGSSRQAIKKYVKANNDLGNTTDAALSTHINSAIANGVKSGEFLQPKGTSGPVKLAKKGTTATKSTTKKSTTAKKPAAKATTAKKATTTKKTAAPKTKANVAKPRKTAVPKKPAAAPAVEEKKPVVVGKTKSGRVTKSSAPAAPAKKAAAKKAAPKKKATATAA